MNDQIPHGTVNGYGNLGCRCKLCREAHRLDMKRRRAKRHKLTQAEGLPDHVPHGASAYGNWGCRCDVCTKAWSAKCLETYHRRKKKAS